MRTIGLVINNFMGALSNEDYIKWSGVRSVEQDKEYIFVFVDSIMAYIIPKRSFASEKESLEFYHQAQIYFARR